MDPLSITTGVIALLGACLSTGLALKEFHDGATTVNIKIKGLLSDVISFTQVLQLMKDTLEQENVQSSFQSTGHIGNHWNNLSTSIQDGQTTLSQLQETIEKANKSVSLLDGPRRHLRLKSAGDEIAVYQQQIRAYRDTLQLSLQTVILWNQVTVRESTEKILPNLDELQQAVRRLAFDFNKRLSGLQDVIESKSSDHEVRSLKNLRNCVKSAASVVSSASTTLGVEQSTRLSTYGSEFGDCFPPEPSETMLRWISSNTIQESGEQKDIEYLLSGPQSASGQSLELAEESQESDQSDSDGELEAEIIQSLLRLGKEKLASREFDDAERHFRNCLARATSNDSSTSLQRLKGSTSEIMSLLLITYRQQEKWNEAHSLLIKKIAAESRGSSGTNQSVLADRLVLVEVLLQKSAYAEALLHGRRALKSYRRLGSEGRHGVKDSLLLLCKVCGAAGNHDEEDAFNAMLSDLLQQPQPETASTTATISSDFDYSTTTLSAAPIVKREGSVEKAGSHELDNLNTSDFNDTFSVSDQLTPSSTGRSHNRGASLSSLGSAGPGSPNTIYTSFSTTSRDGPPQLKESPLPNANTTFESVLISMPDSTQPYVPEPFIPPQLEEPIDQSKTEGELSPLVNGRSTDTVTSVPKSSSVNDIGDLQAAAATKTISAPVPPQSNLLKRQVSKVPKYMIDHFQKNIEEDAIKYFREKREILPEKTALPVSDFELPQWVGTLEQDTLPTVPITVSAEPTGLFVEPPKRPIQKSKSALDLFDSGVVELPTDLLQKSKSTLNLRDQSAMPRNYNKIYLTKPAFGVNEEDDWDAIYHPPGKNLLPISRRVDTENNIGGAIDKIPLEAAVSSLNRSPSLGGGGFDRNRAVPVVRENDRWGATHRPPSSESVPNEDNSGKSIGPQNVLSSIATSPAPSKQSVSKISPLGIEIHDAPIPESVDTSHDPLVETLVGMGYSQSKALDALKTHDFNLERAADYLITEASKGPESASLSVKHTRSTSKEKHMGVLDFRFFVDQVSKTGKDSEVTTVLPSTAASGLPLQPLSFQELVRVQSKRKSAISESAQHAPIDVTGRWSNPGMTVPSIPLRKSTSLQDENLRPRNPLAAQISVDSYPRTELMGKRLFIANDLSTELVTRPTSQTGEQVTSYGSNIHDQPGANSKVLPAITFSEILNDSDSTRRKLVIIGDPFCGKSTLCSVFSKKIYPGTYHPTGVATSTAHIDVDGKTIELVLWDTGGNSKNTSVRLKCYPDAHLVLLCFSIGSPDSLHNAEELFTKELQNAPDGAPKYILVGLKGDLRQDGKTIDRMKIHFQHPVTRDEAQAVALRIGAAKYVECSAMTGEFVKDVFETATRLSLMPNQNIKKKRSLRRMLGKD